MVCFFQLLLFCFFLSALRRTVAMLFFFVHPALSGRVRWWMLCLSSTFCSPGVEGRAFVFLLLAVLCFCCSTRVSFSTSLVVNDARVILLYSWRLQASSPPPHPLPFSQTYGGVCVMFEKVMRVLGVITRVLVVLRLRHFVFLSTHFFCSTRHR